AAAAHHHEAARLRERPDALVCDGATGALHQLRRRLGIAGVASLGGAHLLDRVERLVHQAAGRGRAGGGAARSATQVAPAIVCECVSETSISRMPTRSAQRSVFPERVTPGLGGPTISISFQVNRTPHPSAFPTASFPQKRA